MTSAVRSTGDSPERERARSLATHAPRPVTGGTSQRSGGLAFLRQHELAADVPLGEDGACKLIIKSLDRWAVR